MRLMGLWGPASDGTGQVYMKDLSVGAGGTAVNYATWCHDSYDPVFSANRDEIAFVSDSNSCLSAQNSLRL